MEQKPLEEITSLNELKHNVHKMFSDVLKCGTLAKSWRMDVRLLSAMALEHVAEALVESATIKRLSLEWSVGGGVFTPYKIITAKVSVTNEGETDKWALKRAIDSHFGDRVTGSVVIGQDNAYSVEGMLSFKYHDELKELLRKFRADVRKDGVDIEYDYSNELQETPVKFIVKIKSKPVDKVEYKQLESNSGRDLVSMIEWVTGKDASSIQGVAEAAARKSFNENGCLILSTGKSNILVKVGEWVVKINGKLNGVISDEFKKHACGE